MNTQVLTQFFSASDIMEAVRGRFRFYGINLSILSWKSSFTKGWWHVYTGSYTNFFSLWHHGGCQRPFSFLWYECYLTTTPVEPKILSEFVGFQTIVVLDPNGMTSDAVCLAFWLLFRSCSSYYVWPIYLFDLHKQRLYSVNKAVVYKYNR